MTRHPSIFAVCSPQADLSVRRLGDEAFHNGPFYCGDKEKRKTAHRMPSLGQCRLLFGAAVYSETGRTLWPEGTNTEGGRTRLSAKIQKMKIDERFTP